MRRDVLMSREGDILKRFDEGAALVLALVMPVVHRIEEEGFIKL